MTDGLKDTHRTAIINLLRANERVERAVLFGSRATETFTHGSDVDIAVFGKSLTTTDQARLAAAMEELAIPQMVDLLLYEGIEDATLREHVRRHGIELYRRQGNAPAIRLHLLPKHRQILEVLMRKHLPDVEAWAYGSRVNGRSHDGSDLDLVLRGPGLTEIPSDQLKNFKESVRESNIPFMVEAKDWARVSQRLHREIKRDYMVLKKKEWSRSGERLQTIYGTFSDGFLEDSLINLCDRNSGVQTGPFGSQLHKEDYVSIGTPIITVEHLGDNYILHQRLPRVSDTDRDRLSKYILRKGDIVFSRVGSVDRRALVRQEEQGWLFSGRCLRIRPDPVKIDSRYLSYFFGLEAFREHIRSIAVGATMPSLNTQILSDVKIIYPPLAEQRVVAHILGSLDDKIELNRQINETLEAMAQAIFKDWFVDFGPVRAKMKGREPYLPPEIWKLFPDRLIASEHGEIPKGWTVKTLGTLCHKPQYGYTASAQREPVGPKFIRITDINKRAWIDWRTVPYCEISNKGMEKYRLHHGDILIARIADPGYSVVIEKNREAVFASYLIRFRSLEQRHVRIIQYWLKSERYWNLVKGRSAGTTRVSLNAKVLSEFLLLMPSDSIADAYTKCIDQICANIVSKAKEMQTLAKLRDTLLPRLISGEICIAETKRIAEAAA